MIGPRPCAYACAYVDPVFTSQSYQINISTSTRRTNLYVFLVLMLMSTQFSLAYACACAYAYALVKTRLYCDLVKMRYTYWLQAACWASLHKPFRKPFGWCIWDTPPLFETGILVASQVSWSWHISSLSRCLPLPDQPTGKLYGTIYLNKIKICKSNIGYRLTWSQKIMISPFLIGLTCYEIVALAKLKKKKKRHSPNIF